MASGERKLVALLFADLSGFTALASSLDPEEVYAFVRPGLEDMRRIAEEHGGSVPHVMGDGFMAVFGVPATHEDDAERAVRAALAVRDHARTLGQGRAGIRFPDVHAGVNSGEVMVAPSSEPGGFAILGDPVNVAARLADLAPPGVVLVAEPTKRRTEHAVRYGPGRATGPRASRGRSWPSRPSRSARPCRPGGPPRRSPAASSTATPSWRRSGGRWPRHCMSVAPTSWW